MFSMDKDTEQKLKEQRNQFTMVLENIHSYNRVFGEMLLGINNKVDKLETKVDRLETKLDATFEEVGRLREDVTEMNEKKRQIICDSRS